MRGIREFDQHAMRAGREALDDQRLAARVHPVPRRVVDGHVHVTDSRQDVEGSAPEDGDDTEILGAILYHDEAADECVGKRRGDDESRRLKPNAACPSPIPSLVVMEAAPFRSWSKLIL